MSIGPHLLAIADCDRDDLLEVMHVARSMSEIARRPIPRVPALRGRTVATLFFENSTRTRLSFEAAAKRLSADTMSFAVATSSVSKGESIRDTVETLKAMGVDAMVVRHSSSGVPQQITQWVDCSVINAGDGQHEHPSQALTDCFTILDTLARRGETDREDLSGLRIAIVGDVRHSRVARSNIAAMHALGASIVLVAPRTLLPPSLDGWPVDVSADLDEALEQADVCYMLRLQSERIASSMFPSVDEYHRRFALTDSRAARLKPEAMIMHPGPMNRGVEIDDAVASSVASLVGEQVTNGVAVRMAILFLLLGAPRGAALDLTEEGNA